MPLPKLSEALRDQHETTLIRQAETIRDWPRGRERNEQAEIHVRLALWEQGRGRISQAVQSRVYSLLSFVMPADAFAENEAVPTSVRDQAAEYEAAYNLQLEQRSCPECGDGLCPVDR